VKIEKRREKRVHAETAEKTQRKRRKMENVKWKI